jgi:hypothetical protein
VKLAIVTGFTEYLLPHAVDHAGLARLLRARLPGAVVPSLRWHASGGAFEDHRFLLNDELTRDKAIDLFLEFAADAAGPGRTVVALLPHESALDRSGGTMATLVDQFMARAVQQFGTGEVLRLRLYLSDNSQAVLTRLHSLQGPPAPVAAAGADARAGGEGIPVEAVALDTRAADAGALAAIRRNYRRSVLVAAEALVGRDSVFVGAGRGDLLDTLLDGDNTAVPTDALPEQIVASLRPGGRLFELLTRPVQLPAPPAD